MTNKQWSPTDSKHFEGKTLKELQQSLKLAEDWQKKQPLFQYGWYNEYVQELRRRIAESIGRK